MEDLPPNTNPSETRAEPSLLPPSHDPILTDSVSSTINDTRMGDPSGDGDAARTPRASTRPPQAISSRRARRQRKLLESEGASDLAESASILSGTSMSSSRAGTSFGQIQPKSGLSTLPPEAKEEEGEDEDIVRKELAEATKEHIEAVTEGIDAVDFFGGYHGKYKWDIPPRADVFEEDEACEHPTFEFHNAITSAPPKSSQRPKRPNWHSHLQKRMPDAVRSYAIERPDKERLFKRDSENYFSPADTVAKNDEIEHSRQSEGFYVGNPPEINRRQLSKIQNRVKQSHGKDSFWMTPEGNVAQLPDPILEWPMRLPESHDYKLANGTDERSDYWYPNLRFRRREGAGCAINIVLHSVQFKDHFLFLEENRLARELEDLVEADAQRTAAKTTELLTLKLNALKDAHAKLVERLKSRGRMTGKETEFSQADAIGKRLRARSHEYRGEIKATRELRDTSSKFDLSTKESIVITWNQLRELRKNQQFASTPHVVKFRRRPVNADEENAEFDAEVAEMVKEEKDNYEAAMETKRWKYREKKAVEAAKSQRPASPIVYPKELTSKFDKRASEAVIRDRLLASRRPPGVPDLEASLHFTSTTPSENLKNLGRGYEEEARRTQILDYVLGVDVIVNGRRAYRTSGIMKENFEIQFVDEVELYLDEMPREIIFYLWEESKRPLCEIYVPVPESSGVGQSALVVDGGIMSARFSCDRHVRKVTADDVYVSSKSHPSLFGTSAPSNFDHQDNPQSDDQLIKKSVHFYVMNGIIQYNIAISPSQRHHLDTQANLNNAAQNADAIAALGAQGVRDYVKLAKWAKEVQLDPNDPRNAHLLSQVNAIDKLDHKKFYRLLSDDAGEASMARGAREMERSKRHRLMYLRTNATPGFENKVIALMENDIIDSELEPKKRGEGEVLINWDEDQPRFLQTSQAKYLRQVRASQAARQRQLAKRQTLHDVVNDNLVPTWTRATRSFLEAIFGPPRPLRPVRKVVKKLAPSHWPKESKILVRVIRAWGLPVRTIPKQGPAHRSTAMSSAQIGAGSSLREPGSTTLGVNNTSEGHSPTASLSPFVEVMFQNETVTTSVILGPSPAWNEQFELTFIPPGNNFSPASLKACKDVMHFNIFDHVEIDLTDQQQRDTHKSVRREKRFLGSFSIPVAIILENQIIDGTFELDVPLAMLSYVHNLTTTSGRPKAFLSLYLSAIPPLEIESPTSVPTESYEDPQLIAYGKHWAEQITRAFPERVVYPLAQDIEGMSVIITRYVHLQHPPPSLSVAGDSTLVSMRRLARFVSMIPNANDSDTFVGAANAKLNLWTSSDQFIQLRSGDHEEHAILLCNYFLSLAEVEAWVVLGTGLPDGELVYVLSKHTEESTDTSNDDEQGNTSRGTTIWLYWDPLSGKPYKMSDTLCPLQQVFAIFNESNIWGNIQPRITGVNVKTDLNKKTFWKPFFSSDFPRPTLATVQIEQLNYFSNSADEIRELESTLEVRLKSSFEKLRQLLRLYTKWNLSCSRSLKLALQGIAAEEERSSRSHRNRRSKANATPSHRIDAGFEGAWVDYSKANVLLAPLDHIVDTHRLTGVPINFPFTTYTDACERLHRTNLHSINEEQLMEFAMAVHVVPYGNGIFSIWIYCATIDKLNDDAVGWSRPITNSSARNTLSNATTLVPG